MSGKSVFEGCFFMLENNERRFKGPAGTDMGLGELADYLTEYGAKSFVPIASCTHVIGASWTPNRQVFKGALKRKLPIVSEDWCYASIEAGAIVDTAPYILNPDAKPTPKKATKATTPKKRPADSESADSEGDSESSDSKETRPKKKQKTSTTESKAIAEARRAISRASKQPHQVAKSNPTYPSSYLLSLFNDVENPIQKNATFMVPVCDFIGRFLKENGIVVPAVKKKTQSQVGVGRIKAPVPALLDEEGPNQAGDLVSGEITKQLRDAINELCGIWKIENP